LTTPRLHSRPRSAAAAAARAWNSEKPASRPPSAGRVRRWCCHHPLPSERRGRLSTHAAQVLVNAPAKARGPPVGLGNDLDVTGWEPTTEPSEAAPARRVARPPTDLLCFLKSVCPPFLSASTRGKSAGFRRGVILPGGATPLQPITGWLTLPPRPLPAALTARLAERFPRGGELRAYHVALT
jgi:hypothetical protein